MSDLSSGTGPALVTQGPAQRGLKVVVILLGVLIVIALGLLVFGLVTRLSGTRTASGAPAEGGGSALVLPPGSEILSMQVAERRLILRIKSDAGQEIDIIDTGDGHLIGRVRAASPPR